MPHCPHPEPPRQLFFDILKDQHKDPEEEEKKQKVERQFRRIYDPNASWVVVTGFPQPATDRILITFRSVGRIVGKQWTKDGLHLQFSSPCESAQAVELDNLCIAGYPVRVKALPRLTSFDFTQCPTCPLRQMGASSNRIMCREETPCYVGFFSSSLRASYMLLDIFQYIYERLKRLYASRDYN